MEGEVSILNKIASPEAVIETLTRLGWSFGKIDQLHALISIQSALSDDADASTIANSVESELLNTDLRSVGGKSLPDPISLRKVSHLQGPKVLQVASVRDISVSSMEGFSGSSNRRLLRLGLTDGHVEVTAVEYSRIPSIDIDIVVPGTKVRLENRVPVHSGIVCLGPKVITVIGGVVESLYEEWKMNKKYAGLSRSSLRVSQESDGGGPPPFEKLQIMAPNRCTAQRATHPEYVEPMLENNAKNVPKIAANFEIRMPLAQSKLDKIEGERTTDSRKRSEKRPNNSKGRGKEAVALCVPVQNHSNAQKYLQKISQPNQVDSYSSPMYKAKGKLEDLQVFTLDKEIDPLESTCRNSVPIYLESAGSSEMRPFDRQHNAKGVNGAMSVNSYEESIEQKANTSETRPKEAAESGPVHNQAAAQKLLHKMSQSDQAHWHSRGRGPRGRVRQENQKFITLDEWERRKLGTKAATKDEIADTTLDEDVALQLQHQLDLEDSHARRGKHNTVADDIRMNMFSYGREANLDYGTEHGGRGRGRGKGRGRGGAKGRGRGRHY